MRKTAKLVLTAIFFLTTGFLSGKNEKVNIIPKPMEMKTLK